VPAVVFDFDGLMIDSEYALASEVIRVLAGRGVTIGLDDIGHLFGSTDVDHLWEAMLIEHFDGAYTLTELEAELDEVVPALVDALPLLPGVMEVLDAAAGWRIGLATGQRRARVEYHLDRLGVLTRFDAIVTAADVALGKPAPDIFLAVADALGVPPADCLVLEDSVPGAQGALAAGMRVVVCPSRVTAACVFPPEAERVENLNQVAETLRRA